MLKYFLVMFLALMASQVHAHQSRKSFSFEGGTLGLGFAYALKAPFYQSSVQTINLRFAVNLNSYTLNTDVDVTNPGLGTEQLVSSKDYLAKSFVSALVDWHPYNNGFRATFGITRNDSSYIYKQAYSNASVTIGGTQKDNVYMNVESELHHEKAINPYLGIGYGHNMKAKRGIKFNFALGVIAQSDPKHTYKISGESKALFSSSLDKAKQEALAAAKKTKGGEFVTDSIVPHVSVGIEIRF